MIKVLSAPGCALLLAGCVTNHALPTTAAPNVIERTPVPIVRAFVDSNGTFYPDDWPSRDVVGDRAIHHRHSILNALAHEDDPGKRSALRRYEDGWLNRVAAALDRKRRVFVLVHGFNDPAPSAANSYWMVENNLDLEEGDAVVEFFWDGLDAGGTKLGAGRIWFWSTGYSQVAGSRGLRRILNRISGAEIYIISHSRGASVALSALGNPPYDPDFSEPTNRLCFQTDQLPPASRCESDFLAPPEMRDGGNRIHLLMLAPAVGNPDFWARTGPGSWRDFEQTAHGQLVSIRHTVNPDDPVLKKYVRGLTDRFNATDLGYDPAVSASLGARFPLRTFPVSGLPHHDFPLYVRCDVVVRMFEDAGIGRRQPLRSEGTACWP